MPSRALQTRLIQGFGLLLLVSAVLKIRNPYIAAHGLHWTGLSVVQRSMLVTLGCVVEVMVAPILIAASQRRAAAGIGFVVALGLFVVHGIGTFAGGESCGCFGALAVPSIVSLLLVGIGGFVCGAAFMPRAPPAVRSDRANRVLHIATAVACIAAIGLVVTSPRPIADSAAARTELLDVLAAHDRPSSVVVGTTRCNFCKDALRNAIDGGAAACLVIRQDEEPAPLPDALATVPVHVVSNAAWASLTAAAMPRLLFVDAEGRVTSPP